MRAELVQLVTADDVTLGGAFFDVAKGKRREGPVDAFLLIHRSGGDFYSSFILALAKHLRKQGYPCASFDNSGHEIIWNTEGSSVFWGAAFEVLDRCRLDIQAMTQWLASRGFHRIALVGHAMGATKVVYYQALERDPNVAAAVAISPIRLSYSYYMNSPDGPEFRKTFAHARHLIHSGRGSELMYVSFPNNHLFNARTYVDKHGPDERYNLLKYVGQLTCPLLVLDAAAETDTRLQGFPAELVNKATHKKVQAKLIMIEGTDRNYVGKEEEAAVHTLAWVESLGESTHKSGLRQEPVHYSAARWERRLRALP